MENKKVMQMSRFSLTFQITFEKRPGPGLVPSDTFKLTTEKLDDLKDGQVRGLFEFQHNQALQIF